LIHNFSIWT